MTTGNDIARICGKLRELHGKFVAESGVDVPELIEAATALEEVEHSIGDLIALDQVSESMDAIKESQDPPRYMKHPMDINQGINVYHPLNKAETAFAIYIHECLYIHAQYKRYRRDKNNKQLPSWIIDWEWRPTTELMTQKYRAGAISDTGRKLIYKPGKFYWKSSSIKKVNNLKESAE